MLHDRGVLSPRMERCPQCGEQVWGFVQQPLDLTVPAQLSAPETWPVTVFPCEHVVTLAIPEPSVT